MKILIYSAYFLTPVLERDLELIANHIEQGDDVHVVRCTGQLGTCLLNAKHRKSICAYCRGKYARGYQMVDLRADHILELPACQKSLRGVPDKFADIDALKAYEHEGADIGMTVASTLIWRFNKDHRFNTIAHRAEVAKEIDVALFVYESALGLLRELQPDRVYLFNGRHSTFRPVLRACEKLGTDYYTHERAGVFSRYRLCRNTLPHDIGAMADDIEDVWSKGGTDREQIGSEFYINRKGKIETAWFCFIKNQQTGMLPAGYDRERKNVVIYNSTLEEMEAIPGRENRIYKDEIDGIKRILTSFEGSSGIHFYLRLHPNLSEKYRKISEENNTQLRELREIGQRYGNVTVIPPASPIDSYALMESAKVIVTFGSTVCAEACYWGKPSILAGGRAVYERLDCCYKPESHDELVALVNSDLEPRNKLEAIKYGYWEMRKGVPYKRFKQTGVLKGTYLGKTIVPSLWARLYCYLLRITEVTNLAEMREFVSDFKKLLTRS